MWKNKPLRWNPKGDKGTRLIQAFENNSLNNYFRNNDTLRGYNTQIRVVYVSQMYSKTIYASWAFQTSLTMYILVVLDV